MAIIKPKRSETASSVPTTSNLSAGEIAVNIIDKKIYVRDSSNNIIEVANNNTSGGSSYSPDAHLNTSSATANQILTWNGTDYDWIDGQTSDNQKEFTASGSISAGDVVRLNEDGTVSKFYQTLDNPNAYDTPDNDYFGRSVSISESYAIVGAYFEDDAGGTTSGKAYIYDTSTGNLLHTLDNPNAYNTSSGDHFGWSVSISESYAIVGAYFEDDAGGTSSGKAYIFSTSTGNLLHTLDNPNAYDTSSGDWFGISVSISESYAIVGAYTEDDAGGTESGKAYIYDTSTGNLLHTLDNPNAYGTSAGDNFGRSVSISESYAIVGAHNEDDAGGTSSGKAYIYSTSTGNLLYTLDDPNASLSYSNDYFGYSVSISESYAIVGAYGEDASYYTSSSGAYNQAGVAYIYSTSTGNLLYTLNNPNAYDTPDNDYFGWSVSISESYAIVGAHNEDDAGGTTSGKAYIYDLSTLTPGIVTSATFVLDNPNAYNTSQDDYFGIDVSISESHAIAGAYVEDDAGGLNSGKAYIYQNLVLKNQIGIASENISDAASGLIDLPGAINSNQSGLNVNSIYYINIDGSLTTTQIDDSILGMAISSTELQIFEWDYVKTFKEQKQHAYGILHIFR